MTLWELFPFCSVLFCNFFFFIVPFSVQQFNGRNPNKDGTTKLGFIWIRNSCNECKNFANYYASKIIKLKHCLVVEVNIQTTNFFLFDQIFYMNGINYTLIDLDQLIGPRLRSSPMCFWMNSVLLCFECIGHSVSIRTIKTFHKSE